jgi:hypothetical protein
MRIAVFLVVGSILAFFVFGLVVGAVAYSLMPGRVRRSWLFKSMAIGEVDALRPRLGSFVRWGSVGFCRNPFAVESDRQMVIEIRATDGT